MFFRLILVLLLLSTSSISATVISIRATGSVDNVVNNAGLFDFSGVQAGDVVTFEWRVESSDFVGGVTGPGQDITSFLSLGDFRIFDNSGDIVNVDFRDFFGPTNILRLNSRGAINTQGDPIESAVLAFINHNADNSLRLENRLGSDLLGAEFGNAEFDNQTLNDIATFIHNNAAFASFAAVANGQSDRIQLFSGDGTNVVVEAVVPEPQTYCLFILFGLIFFSKRKS